MASANGKMILQNFVEAFAASFDPPPPSRGKSGNDWLVSRVWSEYFKTWLCSRYSVRFEYPVDSRRLDAVIWNADRSGAIDMAIEWEWDNNKVDTHYPTGDFRKLFEINASCGLAIVQTRVDGRRGPTQAERVLGNLRRNAICYGAGGFPTAVIEARRTSCQRARVEFACLFHDLNQADSQLLTTWSFAAG